MIFQLGGVHGNGNVRTVQDVFSMDIKDLRFCYIVASFKIDQFLSPERTYIIFSFWLSLLPPLWKYILKDSRLLVSKSSRTEKYIKHRERKYIILLFSTFFSSSFFFFTRIITDIMSARIFSNGRRNVGKIKHRKTLQKVIILQYLNSPSSFSIDILETAS